jgi:pSer/pThr/pTyr-binding forkhead associated (FHA) protein
VLVAFTKPKMLVGRDPKCDVVVDDPAVSPRHLTVATRDPAGDILVTPLAGTTLVNGRAIATATLVKGEDALQIGDTVLTFGPKPMPTWNPPRPGPIPPSVPRLPGNPPPPQDRGKLPPDEDA